MPKDEYKVQPPLPWYRDRSLDANRKVLRPTTKQHDMLKRLGLNDDCIDEMTRAEAREAISSLLEAKRS